MKNYVVKQIAVLILVVILLSIMATTALAMDNSTFTPYLGHSVISSDSSGRYATERTYWRAGSLTAFQYSTDTYEHQVIFYNYDGTAYASGATSYVTNIPDPYLDTQFADSTNENNIAVGTYSAYNLTSGTWYETTIRLKSTTSSSSKYKISGQKGYWIMQKSPLTVFGSATSTIMPFNSYFLAPDTRDWKYEWESNNSMNSSADSFSLYQWCTGNISSLSDVDYWDFSITYTRVCTFTLIVPSNKDYDLKVYNNSGTQVASSTNGTGVNESVIVTLPSGHYYVKVYTWSGGGSDTSLNYYLLVRG